MNSFFSRSTAGTFWVIHVTLCQLKANTFRDFVSYIKQINRKDKNSSGRKGHIDVQGCFTVA